MHDKQRTDLVAPATGWGSRVLRLLARIGLSRRAGALFIRKSAFTVRLWLEALFIIAVCGVTIHLVLPLTLSSESHWLAVAAARTGLLLTAGPLLWWRFNRNCRSQNELHRLEMEQRTVELHRLNTVLQNEVSEHERSQAFFNSVVEHLPIAVFIKEARELRFVLWNKAGEELTGIPNAEMIGKNDYDFFPEQDAKRKVANDLSTFERKGVLEIPEEIIQTRNCGTRITHVWKVPIFDATGQPAFLLGISQDITERRRAEEELQQSEDRFRKLVEDSPDMIGIYQEGKLVFINSTGMQLLGAKSKEELVGRVSEQVIHPDDLANARDRIHRRLAGETGMYPAEIRYLRLDGTALSVEVTAAPITFDGKPAVQFIARDISERKLARKQLAENERRLRLILESVPECIKLLAVDGTVLDMNPAGLAMYEVDQREQIVGECVFELLPKSYREMVRELNAAVFRGESRTADYEIVGRKGTRRWLETCAVPLRDVEGQIIAQLAVTRDITQRRQAEELLRLQEAAMRSAANGIVITDRQGLIVWTNPAFTRVSGYTAEEALGQNPRILKRKPLPANYPATFYRDLWRTICSGAMWHGEFHNSRKDGTPLIEEATITPVRNEEGKITHFVAVKQDITARKSAEEELAKMQKELLEVSRQAGMAEVATGVLHNVGNVLNSVNVAATCVADKFRKSKVSNLIKLSSMLREHDQDLGNFLTRDPKGKQIPGYLTQLAEHLAAEQNAAITELVEVQKHIDHIKEIVAMQQNLAKVSGVSETLNVEELIEDALSMQDSSLGRHGIAVIKEFDEVPSITVERHKALQILVNLLQNAKQACQVSNRDEKQMTLRIKNGGDRVQITVRDNGVGIPLENLNRIFNHGFTTKKDGHGFGLHNSSNAARELGGKLNAHSDGPDQGATFTLELPVRSSDTSL